MGNSPHIVSIHVLDDDSLLNIFYLYRPFFFCEDETDLIHFKHLLGGIEPWDQGRWWYRLVHVCQRWRNLILGSANYLRLSLVCTNGTPVQNMLAHSPPLPLTVDYINEDGITAEDEEGLLLALEQRNRVRHIRLVFPVQNLQKLVKAIDEEFSTLEYLIVHPRTEDSAVLLLPETLHAPHLRHLALRGFTCPIRPQLYPTAASLVTLYLEVNHPSAYFQPNVLLQWISFMPQLERLVILFIFAVPSRDLERQLTRTPITTHITLPNLRSFWFRGISAYLEAVVCRITTPRLEKLQIQLFNQLTFSIPLLPQFIYTTETLRFDSADIDFSNNQARVETYIRETDALAFTIKVYCRSLDWQVSSATQISNALSQALSAVEHLTLRHQVHSHSSEEHNYVDRIEWRNLLRLFSNVKTLCVEDGLVEELSHCLRLEGQELSLELLPELQELTYFGSRNLGDTFIPFIHARQNAGRSVTLVRHGPRPNPLSSGPPAMTSSSDKAGNDIET